MIIANEIWTDTQLKNSIFFDDLKTENLRQLNKWGVQSHDIFRWLAFLVEEIGELSEAISEYTFREGKLRNIRREAIEASVLALKISDMAREKIINKKETE